MPSLFQAAAQLVEQDRARAISNVEVLGFELYNHLPRWAQMLDWILGVVPRGRYGLPQSDKQYIVLEQVGNKANFICIGERNFNMGECDCCSTGEGNVKAYAFLDIAEYTIPGIEPLVLGPLGRR